MRYKREEDLGAGAVKSDLAMDPGKLFAIAVQFPPACTQSELRRRYPVLPS